MATESNWRSLWLDRVRDASDVEDVVLTIVVSVRNLI